MANGGWVGETKEELCNPQYDGLQQHVKLQQPRHFLVIAQEHISGLCAYEVDYEG